ncbi:MAG: GTP cyclohydrolase I FolE2 [Spirochaetes bacterium]|nr:GTP cyclohydrolase I FolE2 [Spirochaetota bacterium]HNV43864.1 GTP cyclohydrolase FolE2 [Exilispira sp.]MBP8990904.1 GTP cyclohydrolase I FolE2 [Spirochaetota bacterium]HOV46118.1 GTP cyclohydrolase FolE2 [Exilispira sp.]HPO60816.1 GTP cyclohydrolase FolE2 [Exilispira sp.]
MAKELVDVQNRKANHPITIDHVGIKGIKYPIQVFDKKRGFQHTVAEVAMFVDLPSHYKGTHMSRFIEILSTVDGEISVKMLLKILRRMKEQLNAETSKIEFHFPYFIEKIAPVSHSKAYVDYDCTLTATLKKHFSYILKVIVPVHTLCPCSKELCNVSAHNQRSYVSVTIEARSVIWIEDIVDIVERNSSSPIYSYLKRTDEKYITEYAYNHPMFVEDIVRAISAEFEKMNDLNYFKIEAENMESIHNHNAYASIERRMKD